MKYLFMNERIRSEQPDGPVIVCQDAGVQREANEFEFRYRGQVIGRVKFSKDGLAECTTHDVHAWVELEDDVSVAVPVKAEEKKPNSPITFRLNFKKE